MRIEILTRMKEGSLDRRKAQKSIPDDRRFAAIHQAAHAVMVVWLGGWLRGVEIEGVGHGECDRTEYCFRADRYTEEAHVCIACAGWLSEMRYAGESEDASAIRRSDEDLTASIKAVRDARHAPQPGEPTDEEMALARLLAGRWRASDAEVIAVYRRYEALTEGILDEPGIWDAIVAVAGEIIREGVLTGEAVLECIEEHVVADIAFLGFTECRSRSRHRLRQGRDGVLVARGTATTTMDRSALS